MDARVEELLALVFERRERGEPVDLDELSGGDHELAQALERALAHGDDLDRRLRGVARVAGASQADSGGVGTRVGPYVVLGEIARGGMGRVLLAEDSRAEAESQPDQIALKLLDGLGTLGTRGRERFRREAAILRGLVHPGVVRVLDADVDRATPWIAMELVPGETLTAVIDRARAAAAGSTATRPFSPTQAAAIGARLARAVEAVHAAGVLHRDVKPANVILAGEGRVVLVDFGLVREEGTATLTRTGDLLGTPQYMAPEQARGERADERSDVYGIGAVLYELLALRPPHGADGGASDPLNVLARVRRRSAEPLARVAPDVPRDLARVVMRALAFRRARRTPTAAALARDLEAFARGEPVGARGPSLVERADELWRRQRARLPLAAAAVLVATAVVAVVVGTRWMNERARDERRSLVEEALARWIGGERDLALESAAALSAEDEPFAPLLVALARDEDAPASDHPAVAAAARGWSASREGRHAEALAELRAACELAPEDPVPVVVLAQAAERARDYELAAREYRAAVERVPRADVHARLSYAHYKLGNAGEAEQAIRAAIELAPDDPKHRFAHARVLGALKRREDALDAARRGAELAGEGASKVQMQILSAALDQADRHAEARDVLRRVLVQWPGDAQALHNLVFSLQLDHHLREALEVCEELARTGDRAFALATQAWIRAGCDHATCAECQRVYAQDPDLLEPGLAEEQALEALRLGGSSDQVPLVAANVAKVLGRPARIRALLEELQKGEQEDARIALFERALRQLAE